MAETSLKRFGESSNQIEERSLQTQQNTKNNRRCVWNQFQQFCNERGYELTNETSTQQIATILTDWAVNMRRSNGEEYKEYSVKTIWNVTAKIIQEKYLKEYNRSFNPFFDQEFKRARDARKAKRKQLQAIPEKRKVSTKALKSEQYRAMIDSCDENTPVGLQFKFYLIASQELGWRGRDGSNCLVHYFREDVSNDGKSPRKIAYNPEFSRSLLRGVPYLLDTKWLVENEDISKCPVRLFKLLLQKRTERIKTDYLFLYPNPYYKKSGVWYKNLPLQSNELSKWTRKCAKKVQLNALDQRTVVYSVHSLAGGIPQEQALGPPQEEALGLPQDQVLTNITRPMSATSSKQMVQINQQCNSTVVSELSTAKL
ncbi:hypothetical protein C0J52_13719 [Blattella germanica]|nr:hypothetical protein C0J52_13719 [Blattella germanica]